jgi:hypothetical protein
MQLRKVLRATIVMPGILLASGPVMAADDGVVLVGCDLFSEGGPEVTFVQSHGVSESDSGPRRLIGISRDRSDDLEGSNCAEVLSGAIDDGLEFEAMAVFGEDSGRALWFFRED